MFTVSLVAIWEGSQKGTKFIDICHVLSRRFLLFAALQDDLRQIKFRQTYKLPFRRMPGASDGFHVGGEVAPITLLGLECRPLFPNLTARMLPWFPGVVPYAAELARVSERSRSSANPRSPRAGY